MHSEPKGSKSKKAASVKSEPTADQVAQGKARQGIQSLVKQQTQLMTMPSCLQGKKMVKLIRDEATAVLQDNRKLYAELQRATADPQADHKELKRLTCKAVQLQEKTTSLNKLAKPHFE